MKWMCMGMIAVSALCAADASDSSAHWRIYIGTYTGGASEGIYLLSMDRQTGAIEEVKLAGAVENPSFLALHPTKPLLYSVGQGRNASGERLGLASAFAVDPATGALTLLNQESTVGAGPCHLTVDRAGRHVLVANYGGGSVAVLPMDEKGGLLEASDFVQHEGSSVHPNRQQQPHAHAVRLDAAGKFAFVIDLGMDKIMIYRYNDETGKLEANEPPHASVAPGAGPRHFAFHPSERFAYVVNELNNTVTAFAYDAGAGRLDAVQTLGTLPEDFELENTTAEICVHPSGRFVYASNRGHDSIAAFAIDPETGRMTALGQTPTGGRTPRNFSISPDGAFLVAANQQSGNVTVFRIDPESGALDYTGHQAEVPSPVCVLFPAP
jgi:6-phosphogluconolactonase